MASTERFGYEWGKFCEIYDEHEQHFLEWVYPLTKNNFKNKIVLDAGGLKKLIFCIKYGAKKVIILDYDKRTVAAARKNLSKFRNAQVLYKDIYKIAKDIHFKEII